MLKHFEENPSETATRLTQDLYVDNVLTSFSDEIELIDFYSNSRDLLQRGSFNLRSWNSNSEKLQHLARNDNVLDSGNEMKILGMRWDVHEDKLSYPKINMDTSMKLVTKREIFSQSSKIFDPLGILSPVTVKAKTLMQTLWKRNLGWDECLPVDLSEEWTNLATELSDVTDISVSRLLHDNGVSSESDKYSLHIFQSSR